MQTEVEEHVEVEKHLPGIEGRFKLLKLVAIMTVLALINAVTFVVSFGFGLIVTLPLTVFIGFLVARDLLQDTTYPWSGWRAYWRH
jgi:hypothetical protein